MGINDLNAVALNVGVICRHRPMPEQLASTANGTSLSLRCHHNNAVLQVKTCVNAGMAKLVNVDAGMDLARGERCEGVKKSPPHLLIIIYSIFFFNCYDCILLN